MCVYKHIHEYSQHVGIIPPITDYIDDLCSAYPLELLTGDTPSEDIIISTGRIAVLNNQENKQRIVAIVDWFSQSLLRPLHDYVHSFTKFNVPCSHVDDQITGINIVKGYTKPGGSNTPMS
jgi:hypothetical protein